MSSFNYSSTLEAQYSKAAVDVCEVNGCKMDLEGFPPERVIIDLDILLSSKIQGKRCDYLIFSYESNGDNFFFPIEFKSGTIVPERVKKQLEGGVNLFKKKLERDNFDPKDFNKCKCCPVLVSRNFTTQLRKKLRKVQIKFGKRDLRIRHQLCNKALEWGKVKK